MTRTERCVTARFLVAAAVMAISLTAAAPPDAFAESATATVDLFAAIAGGDANAARAAADRGADLTARNADGATPLGLAINLGRLEIARLLYVAQQRVAARDALGKGIRDPFDPTQLPEGSYHPVQISADAIRVVATGPARREPAQGSAASSASHPVPTTGDAPKSTVSPPAEPGLFTRLARWLGLGEAATEDDPAPAAPTATPARPASSGDLASADEADQGDAIIGFFRGLFGLSKDGPDRDVAAVAATESLPIYPVSRPAVEGAEPSMVVVRPPEMSRPTASTDAARVAPLEGVTLTIGETLRLGGQRTLSYGAGAHSPAGCVLKQRGTVAFCIEPTVWKDGLDKQVAVASIMYHGAKAVARYDRGAATRIHSLFPSEAFAAVAGYYERKYGPPTDSWQVPVRQPGVPVRENSVRVWRSRSAEGVTTVLDIREHDEARGGFVDIRLGSLTLHDDRDLPIFPLLSQFDVMMVK